MRLERIAMEAVEHLLGRLLRRLMVVLVAVVLALVALYHFEASGLLALEAQYGAINAHLIVGGAFAAATLLAMLIWWAMGRGSGKASAPALPEANPRQLQLAMLVEAVMLGYALARKSDRAP
jgi:hypothetical protein